MKILLMFFIFLQVPMPPKKYASLKELNDHFTTKGSKIIAVIGKNGEELPLTEVPLGLTKVKWQCANNKSHTTISNLKGISVGNRDLYVCRACGISKSKGGSFDKFVETLKDEGWSVISPRTDYTNNKCMMIVKCSVGHTIKTTQNKFSTGHRCKQCNTSSKRVRTVSDVANEFKTKGFTLLATTYKNNAEPMDYVCKCGRQGKITYNNFLKNIDGCKDCTRRWTYAEVEDFFEDHGCKLLGDSKPEFVLNATKVSYECFCGSPYTSTWRLFKNGARCTECTKASIRETCMAIYGVDNPSKCEPIKQKIKDTMLERYGVEYAMQIKEFSDMAKETNIKNHGGKHNLTLPGVREDAAEAYEKKYGAKFGFVEEHQEKGKKVTREKYGTDYYISSEHCKKAMKEKYGTDYHIMSDHFTEVMIRKYGVPHAMQHPEFLSKAMLTAYSSKDYITPLGKQWKIQGYENHALDLLLAEGIAEDDIVVFFDNIPTISYTFEGKEKIYFPDIFIKSLNLIIEVKSEYTFLRDRPKNIAKFQATAKLYNFELWIFNSKGVRITRRPFATAVIEFT